MNSAAFSSMFTAIIIFTAVITFIICEALNIIPALYAKKKGVKNWGLMFVPCINNYIYGALADQYVDKKYRILLPVLSVISSAIYFPFYINYQTSYLNFMELTMYGEPSAEIVANSLLVPMLLMLAAAIPMLVYAVFNYIAFYRMFAYANKGSAVMWLLLTIFLSIPLYIFLLVYMNKSGCPRDGQNRLQGYDNY